MITMNYCWRKIYNRKTCTFLFLLSSILSFASPIFAHESNSERPVKPIGMVEDSSVSGRTIYQTQPHTSPVSLTEEEQKWLEDHPGIKLGIPGKLVPYIIVNADGTQSGILKDLIDTMNKRLGTEVSIEVGEWNELLEKSRNKSIGGVLALKDEHAERQGLLKTINYFTTYPVVFSKDNEKFKSMDDLVGKRVSILKENYYQDEILEPYRETITVIRVSNSLEALQMVYEGKADATIGLSSFNYLITKYHLSGIAPSFIIWNRPTKIVMGIRSDWPELVDILNKGIDSFTDDELNGFVSKWFSMPVKLQGIELDRPEKEFIQNFSTIRVAIDPHWAPIEYIDDLGKPLGIIVDLIKNIETRLNISFELIPGDSWLELLGKEDRGEIDVFPSMVRTSEREKQFEFTSPYISFPIVIFAKKDMPYIADLKELSQKRAAVITGHAIDEWLTKDYPEIELVRAKSIQDAIEALYSGSVDAYLGNILPTSTLISKKGYSGQINVVGETQYTYDLCFAVRKDMAPLIPILQKGVDTITESEKNEIRRKWTTIGYKHSFDYSLLWKGAIGVSIIIILILLWNRHLSREVDKRTKALELNKWVVTQTSIGTAVFRSSGECIMANEAAAFLVGGTVESLLKLNFRKIKDWPEIGALDLAEKALDSETEQTGDISTTTTSGKEVVLHCRFIPFRFKEEHHLMLMFEDISKRKQAEEKIRESEQKYRTLFNSASDAIFLIEDDRFIDCNYKTLEMFACTRDQILDKPPYLFSPEKQPDGSSSAEKAKHLIFRAFKGFPQFFEWQHMKKDGTLFDAEVTLSAFNIGEDKFVLAIVRDISERKKIEEEKERLEKQVFQTQKMDSIGMLAGGIAHDFNNILSSIFGYTELAKMGIASGENVDQNLDEVLNAASRAKNLVKHILTFSRQSNIKKSPTILSPLIKEALKFIRASIPTTIEINHDLVDGNLRVFADPTQIHQIIMNLCTNAAYAMRDKGGMLDIRLREAEIIDETTIQYKEIQKGKYLRLTIADTGTGIEKRDMERIFDPFFTTKERGEGTGLGLSVIHGIVKDMGGAISVYSEPGTGTTFHVLIPEYEGEDAKATSKHIVFSKGDGRILFVDDEKAIIDSGSKILECLGYEVISTTSSTNALELFEVQPENFDLVLTDMTMPKMTGLELARELKEIRQDIPIILCTGYSLGLTEARIKKNGIQQMIMKPIISSELAVAIEETLTGSNSTKTR